MSYKGRFSPKNPEKHKGDPSNMSYFIVYKTTNKIDGKYYIGSHKTEDLNDGYIGSGKRLKNAIEKYGVESFEREILHIFNSSEEMFSKEAELVTEEEVESPNCYNLKKGGEGGWDHCIGRPRSKECRDKISEAAIERFSSKENHPLYGKHHSNESRVKMSKSAKGRKVSAETRKKKSESMKGWYWWNNGIESIMAKERPGEEWNRGMGGKRTYE